MSCFSGKGKGKTKGKGTQDNWKKQVCKRFRDFFNDVHDATKEIQGAGKQHEAHDAIKRQFSNASQKYKVSELIEILDSKFRSLSLT